MSWNCFTCKYLDKSDKIVSRDEKHYRYGCIRGYEQEFYQGILDLDKANGGEMGFNDVEDVEVFWMDVEEGIFLTIDNGEYEIIS